MIKIGDCRELIRELPSESVHAVVTSPPYRKKDGFSEELIMDLASELHRVMVPDGLLYLNLGVLAENPGLSWWVASEFFNRWFEFGPTIAWVKSIPELGGHFTPLQGDSWFNRKWEPVFVMGKGDIHLDRLSIGVPYAVKSNLRRFNHEKDLQCPGDVWFIPYETRNGPKIHPDMMPVELARRCILTAGVKPGETVLDPFAGSGTTGLAAWMVNPDIKFIGYELNPKYERCLSERIATEKGKSATDTGGGVSEKTPISDSGNRSGICTES